MGLLGSLGRVVELGLLRALFDFLRVVGKFVRAGHVATHEHWRRTPLVQNELLEPHKIST